MISRELEQWIQSTWKENVELIHVEKLIGGISSSIFRIDIRNQAWDSAKSFVLRAVLPTDSLNEDNGILGKEAIVLKQLASLKDAALLKNFPRCIPRCIAYDATGEYAGVPALLMTYVNGKVSLPPEPSQHWLQELARAISPVHRASAHRAVVPWNYYRYAASHLERHPAFEWSKHPDRWAAIIDHVSQREPSYVPCLIHRDYHPTNALWDESQLQVLGIVDWVNGCMGPAGVDVGHCRSNLVQLYGLQAANAFLEAYIEDHPEFSYDPYWDICSLLDMTYFGPVVVYEGWLMLGFQGLTVEGIEQRIEQYVEDLVQLMHTNRYSKN